MLTKVLLLWSCAFSALPFYHGKMAMAYARATTHDATPVEPLVLARLTRRQQAGVQLAALGAVTVVNAAAGVATVASAAGQGAYQVTASAETLACECRDAAASGYVCKHIRAAVIVLQNRATYDPACTHEHTHTHTYIYTE
jgi:uncharacterized Zn finger protein